MTNYIKKAIKVTKDLPLEEGKEYKTKFQTGDAVIISKIEKNSCYVIYKNKPHLGLCPLSLERIIPETIEIDDFIEVCPNCNKPKK